MENLKTIHYHKAKLTGNLVVPGDKSISHRAIMLGSIAKGKTTISGFLDGDDCLRTIEIFKQLGVTIERKGTEVIIDSPGIANWKTPTKELYAGNSGTTARLMLGILAGADVKAVLTGDESLSGRPMDRVTKPLRAMGASIVSENETDFLPLKIQPSKLEAIDYTNPVASAQVKSAILFAGLHATGETVVREETVSRDHTEQMLTHFGVDIQAEAGVVTIASGGELVGMDVHVPGDISSAAFFMAAAAMVKNSSLTFSNLGLNPTRSGILEVLRNMGADIRVDDESDVNGERSGTVTIAYNKIVPTEISGSLIPRLIDELPIIALLATQAEGTTIIKDAAELRVKETDRIAAVTNELTKLGANIEATDDGMIIHGPSVLSGGTMDSYGDHRLGMMAAITSLISTHPITIKDPTCIDISYPTFFDDLNKVTKGF